MKSKDGPKKRHPVKISNFQRKVEHHQTVLTFGMEESGTPSNCFDFWHGRKWNSEAKHFTFARNQACPFTLKFEKLRNKEQFSSQVRN